MSHDLGYALLAGVSMATYSMFLRLAAPGIHAALGAAITTGVALLVNRAVTRKGASMRRFVVMTVFGLAVMFVAGPALAFQCPKLVKKIEDEAGMRLDQAAADARAKAAQASELHAQGKHAEAEAAAKEGLKTPGI
jgi:hypothetical protein